MPNNIKKFVFIALVFIGITAKGQETLRIMHYNLLNYGNYTDYCTVNNNSVDNKDGFLQTIVNHVLPDVFTVNEMDELTYYHERILDEVLNTNGRNYYLRAASMNYANSYTTNMLYYDSRKLALKSQTVAQTYIRDIHLYRMFFKSSDLHITHDTAYITFIVAHLKAGSNSSDEQDRGIMTDNLMDYLNDLGIADNYVLMGDFNVYSDNEAAIQNILYHSNTEIRFYDPIDQIGDWNNNSYYAPYHTQSTHVSSNGCAASGGLDDRFDFIMFSGNIMNGSDHFYFDADNNLYQALGQDGNRFNSSIIDPANTSVPSAIANALYDMSDHLPIITEISVDQNGIGILPVYTNNNIQVLLNNPVQDFLDIKCTLEEPQPLNLTISNLQGIIVYQTNTHHQNHTTTYHIPANQWTQGLYILTLSNDNGLNKSLKFIKL